MDACSAPNLLYPDRQQVTQAKLMETICNCLWVTKMYLLPFELSIDV